MFAEHLKSFEQAGDNLLKTDVVNANEEHYNKSITIILAACHKGTNEFISVMTLKKECNFCKLGQYWEIIFNLSLWDIKKKKKKLISVRISE